MSSLRTANGPISQAISGEHTSQRPSAEQLQNIIDEAAILNLFVAPTGTPSKRNSRQQASLYRLDIVMQAPSKSRGVRATNLISNAIGKFSHRCVPIPHDYKAQPGKSDPSVPFDPSVSQRFAIQQCVVSLGDGHNSFQCFGTGRTFPMFAHGRPYFRFPFTIDGV